MHRALGKSGLATRDFEPHIGVAFCSSAKEANALKTLYSANFPKIAFRVTHAYVMKRNAEDDPFEPFAACALKGCEKTPLEHKLVLK